MEKLHLPSVKLHFSQELSPHTPSLRWPPGWWITTSPQHRHRPFHCSMQPTSLLQIPTLLSGGYRHSIPWQSSALSSLASATAVKHLTCSTFCNIHHKPSEGNHFITCTHQFRRSQIFGVNPLSLACYSIYGNNSLNVKQQVATVGDSALFFQLHSTWRLRIIKERVCSI